MPKVTCFICKKKIDKTQAYKVLPETGTKNKYCCSKNEFLIYKAKQKIRDDTYEMIWGIYNEHVTSSVLYTQVDVIAKDYSFAIIYRYLKENEDYLTKLFKSKSFVSEYARTKYLIAILKNVLPEMKKKVDAENKLYVCKDVEILHANKKAKTTRRKSFSDLEKEVGS